MTVGMPFSEIFNALNTIVRREVTRFLRVWIQTLIPPIITMSLYFMIFGQLIGRRIGAMGGFEYIDYIVPGLVMLTVITSAYNNVVSSFFSIKFQRNVEELLVSPTPNAIILLGFVLGGMIRGILVGVLVGIVALFFTSFSVKHIWLTLLIILLSSALFSLAGFTNAVFAKKFDDISIVPTFVLTPLTYLGGVFYSIDLLSDTFRSISLANPILYLVNAFRYGILGVSDISLHYAFLVVVTFIVVLTGLNMRLLNRGVGLRS